MVISKSSSDALQFTTRGRTSMTRFPHVATRTLFSHNVPEVFSFDITHTPIAAVTTTRRIQYYSIRVFFCKPKEIDRGSNFIVVAVILKYGNIASARKNYKSKETENKKKCKLNGGLILIRTICRKQTSFAARPSSNRFGFVTMDLYVHRRSFGNYATKRC